MLQIFSPSGAGILTHALFYNHSTPLGSRGELVARGVSSREEPVARRDLSREESVARTVCGEKTLDGEIEYLA